MLLAARKRAPLDRLYAAYGRRLLRRAFAQLRIGGAAFPCGDAPTIAFLNHSAWWDPIVALFLSHDLFRRDGVGLMQGAQLLRYPFFRRVGCFGATTTSLDDARRVSAHAAELVRARARRTLWLFPQGELLPAGAPLRFRSGTVRIARAIPEAQLVPIALRYTFRDSQRPELTVRVGAAFHLSATGGAAELTRDLEQRLGSELERLDADLARSALSDYESVLRGTRSVSDLYDQASGAVRRSAWSPDRGIRNRG